MFRYAAPQFTSRGENAFASWDRSPSRREKHGRELFDQRTEAETPGSRARSHGAGSTEFSDLPHIDSAFEPRLRNRGSPFRGNGIFGPEKQRQERLH